MGRAPCCDKANVKRGPWSPEEDATLKSYLQTHGTGGNWIALPRKAGLRRCGKSCRLRWLNYLRPDIKHGGFTEYEDRAICELYNQMGSRWSVIASHLPGRTDNDVKNYWNTKLKKKLLAGKITLTPNYTPAQIIPTNNATSINTTPTINHPYKPPNNSFVPKLESDHEFPSPFPNSRTTHDHDGLITNSAVHDQRPNNFSYDQSSLLFSFNSPRVFLDFSSDHDQFDNNNNNVTNIPKINSHITSMQDQLAGSGSNGTIRDDSPSVLVAGNDVKAGDGCDGYGWSGASLVDFGFGLPYDNIMNGVSF